MNGPATSLLRDARILELDPNIIDVDLSGRIGFYFEDKAVAFGRLLAVDGQRDVVKVSRAPAASKYKWLLHVGLHRTMGARFEGLPIYAIEVSGKPEQLAQLETSENLDRRVLEPLERAKFIGAYCQAIQERLARENGNLKQQQLAIKSRWAKAKNHKAETESALQAMSEYTAATVAAVYGWQESAAEVFGLSKRTIRNALKIHRQIVVPFNPELVRALADHPIVGRDQKQLLDLASIEREDLRLQALEALLADLEMSIAGALVQVGVDSPAKAVPTKDVKFASTITDSWGRLTLGAKRAFLPEFAKLLTADMRQQMRAALDAEDERDGL